MESNLLNTCRSAQEIGDELKRKLDEIAVASNEMNNKKLKQKTSAVISIKVCQDEEVERYVFFCVLCVFRVFRVFRVIFIEYR